MAPVAKPETILKQAEGLIAVGQAPAALQSLTEMFATKRFRSTPLTSLEPIMLRFVELCVDMRKGRVAKEGLMQYKNIAQNTSVGSIEVVIQKFVSLADAKVQEAQEKAEKAVAEAVADVDDLEATETPESILLGAVSGDQSKDRTDRALVTPWLKFLWESYRTALETLKNNARLEGIYQQIAQQAFKFCLKHQRKVEFRRLCETLRLHLGNVAKYSHQPHSINLQDPETLQRHLDTRFAQLNTSVELELWQEAFRSVEDVHNLLTMAKKAPRPAMMANYYEKLTKIFLMSGNALYHAAAWGKYYAIVTAIGGKSEEELGKLAGQVLISALAVPVGQKSEEINEEVKGRGARLTSLLGLSRSPTRSGLLKDALSRNVLKLAPEPIRSLCTVLEVTFDPLTLCNSIAPILRTLADEEAHARYLPLLQRALLSRLLSQLAQVYSTIKISNLLELLEPLRDVATDRSIYSEEQVEAYIIGYAHAGELGVRVDHTAGSLTFVDDAFTTTVSPEDTTAVQASASTTVRTRLSAVATTLHNSLSVLEPPLARTQEEQQAQITMLVAAANAERKALQLRRALVARRRELLSELSARKEKEEASRRAEASRKEREEEGRKAMEDVRRREQERAKREIESIRTEEARKLAQSLKERGNLKVDITDVENLNTDNLMRLQVEQLEKEKKEREERLRVTTKRIDHIERAYRKDERPLLAKDYELQQANDRATFEHTQAARLEAARVAHQHDLETKKRLSRMLSDFTGRKDAVLAKRGDAYEKRRQAAFAKVEEEKAKRRKAVLKAREEERQRQEEEERTRREREEEEQRLEEERLAEEERLRVEEETRIAAEEAKKREEEEKHIALRKQREVERAAALEEARMRQQREEEAERRRLERAAARKAPTAAPAAAVPVAAGADAWRRAPRETPAARVAAETPPRSESPQGPPKVFRPAAAAAGAGGGWRAREQARLAGGPARPASPAAAPPPKVEAKKDDPKADPKADDDGFQPATKNVWRPKFRQQ